MAPLPLAWLGVSGAATASESDMTRRATGGKGGEGGKTKGNRSGWTQKRTTADTASGGVSARVCGCVCRLAGWLCVEAFCVFLLSSSFPSCLVPFVGRPLPLLVSLATAGRWSDTRADCLFVCLCVCLCVCLSVCLVWPRPPSGRWPARRCALSARSSPHPHDTPRHDTESRPADTPPSRQFDTQLDHRRATGPDGGRRIRFVPLTSIISI